MYAMKKFFNKYVLIGFLSLIVLISMVGCGEESTTSTGTPKAEQTKEVVKKKDKPYTKLVSVKRGFAESCYDYEYGEKDYLIVDLSKDVDANGYNWDGERVIVTTKEGKKLESIVDNKEDISFKFVDSEEYTVKVIYNLITGDEKSQTFKVKKADIVQGKPFDAKQCEEEKTDLPDIDDADIDADVDSPSACGAGRHWVKGHYRSGNWVDGHCRKN